MKQVIIIFILSVLVYGCEPKLKVEKPDNLIAKDKMTEVLHDLFVISAAKGINRRTMELNGIQPEAYLLEKHNIDSLQFAQSNNYYAYNIEVYTEMIETVKQKLKDQKEYFEAIEEKEKEEKNRKKDSTKKAQQITKSNSTVKNRASNLPESN